MSELLALGASHKTAGLAVRERLALLDGQVEPFLRELVALEGVTEAVALSTCNRTELYVVGEAPEQAMQVLDARTGEPLGEALYSARNCDAARHLYRVVSGLDSMVVGEAEIQGQVKRAYERALAARTTGPLTNQLFRAALATGKRVRTETAVSEGHASVATVAVDAARALIGDLSERRVVIVGAGENAEQVARAFHTHGVSTMFVANRHRDRAIALGRALRRRLRRVRRAAGRARARRRGRQLHRFAARDHRAGGARRGAAGPAVADLDLAVPRDIDPACARVDGVTLLDMDALQRAVRGNLSVRQAEAVRAEAIVEDEIQTFAGWLGRLEVLPTLTALRSRGDAVVEELLAANRGRWESLSERDEARVEALARAVVKRLLHEPTERVRELDAEHRHARLQLLRELFGLEEDVASEAGAAAEVRRLAG